MWPMPVSKGGASFGFCPGKATWDPHVANVFRLLIVSAETGTMWEAGGISTQPVWFVEMLSWFLPRYNDLRFYKRATEILGEVNSNKPVKP